jgi:hypothetical protein
MAAITLIGSTSGVVSPNDRSVMAHGHAKRCVMLIHGGGWVYVGAAKVRRELPYTRWLADRGLGR